MKKKWDHSVGRGNVLIWNAFMLSLVRQLRCCVRHTCRVCRGNRHSLYLWDDSAGGQGNHFINVKYELSYQIRTHMWVPFLRRWWYGCDFIVCVAAKWAFATLWKCIEMPYKSHVIPIRCTWLIRAHFTPLIFVRTLPLQEKKCFPERNQSKINSFRTHQILLSFLFDAWHSHNYLLRRISIAAVFACGLKSSLCRQNQTQIL